MRRITVIGMVVVALALGAILYPRLPESMPSHWNLAGEVNGHTPRLVGVLFSPLMMLVLFAVLELLPRTSPRGFEVSASTRAYAAIEISVITLLFAIHCLILAASIGKHVEMQIVIPLMVGALFVVIGNYLGKFSRNFFVGVRTPWTLASDEVWFRTHRLAGPLFIAGGIAIMITLPFAHRPSVMTGLLIGIVTVVAVIPIVYSYVIYRKLEAGAPRE
jgi:uncharacterized membrane protein